MNEMEHESADSFLGVVLADRYELTSILGQGQGGMVFKARHRQLDRFVAVKLLSPESMADKTAFMRFEREAHAIGRLNHPNIVTVFDLGRYQNQRPYLVMDYIEGEDLQDLVAKDGRLPIVRSLRIISQVCSALHHAHKRGVVHRDLKPRNIMVVNAEDVEDFVKIVDFGIAKQSDNDKFNEGLTLEGYVVGTPQYMSPEQCLSGQVDLRADVYAVCGVLFKMITGTTAITGNSIGEIMNNQINQVPLAFEKACRLVVVPAEIQKVIYKGLSKDPDERHQSMAELRAELNEAFAKVATETFGSQDVKADPWAEKYQESDVAVKNMDALREKAMSGDVIAQYELVLRLEYGQGCKANPEEARRWLVFASQKGMKEAQFRIGDHLLRGEAGFDVNAQEAVNWFRKSAEQGYDSAQYNLGWCYETGTGVGEDITQAINFYQLASKQGNAQAAERLRVCVEKFGNSPIPISQLGAAAEQETESNDPDVIFTLACKLRDTGKRKEDKVKAATMFRRAALFGHNQAQFEHASVVLLESLDPDQEVEAFAWLEKEAMQNNSRAKLLLAALLRNGISCTADPQRAWGFIEDLVNQKNTVAQAILACALLTGDGIGRNLPRGITLLKQCIESDDGYSQWKMAICYKNGLGVMKDQRQVEALFQKSAEFGFPQAFDPIWKPAGLQFTEAVQIFKSLAGLGNRHAYSWLGMCYENGLGLPRDINQALSHYEQAHSRGLTTVQQAIERIKANAGA